MYGLDFYGELYAMQMYCSINKTGLVGHGRMNARWGAWIHQVIGLVFRFGTASMQRKHGIDSRFFFSFQMAKVRKHGNRHLGDIGDGRDSWNLQVAQRRQLDKGRSGTLVHPQSQRRSCHDFTMRRSHASTVDAHSGAVRVICRP